MIQSFIYTSENNNLYIYDDQYRLSLLVHPEFEKAFQETINTDSYYSKKYRYLKAHGFFKISKPNNFRILEESMVKESLVHVNQIVFEVTDSCNLNCAYCSLGELYEGYDERMGQKMNTTNAINLLEYIFKLKPRNSNHKMYISFYGGEPLLNMDFIKHIVIISKQLNEEKGLKIEYSMTTNATIIHKYIDFLVANKFNLMISLDGNEKNHSYRVFLKNKKNSFRIVRDNMDMIQREYPEYFNEYVTFNAVLHNRNSLKDIFEFIYTRYNKIPRIAELNTRDIRLENRETLEKMYHSKWKSEAEYQKEDSSLLHIMHGELLLYKELMDYLKYYSINYYVSNINALLHIVEKQLPTGTCTPFSKKIFLTNQNRLLPCEKIKYSYSLGNVNEKVDVDIPEVTQRYNFYYEHLKEKCQFCYAYRFCGVCIFQMNNIDSVGSDKFVCEKFQDQKKFKNKLQHIFSFLEKYPNDFSEILENVIIE